MTTPPPPDLDADGMREVFVDVLIAEGMITSPRVARAFRTVPRHRFVAENTPLEVTYSLDSAVPIKRNSDGVTISSTSAAYLQARMIEQAGIRPGMRVLEIGSGGYNAALLAELVGATGHVTSVDIDADVIDRARHLLAATGYGDHVQVMLADATEPVPGLEQLVDVVLVTVGAWDIALSWPARLVEAGVLVVPLRMNGVTRAIAFHRDGDHWVSSSATLCGFVAMQGDGAHDEHVFMLPDGRGNNLKLRFDDTVPADLHRLGGALAGPRSQAWSGVTVEHGASFADLHLWFACFLPGFAKLAVDGATDLAVDPKPRFPFGAVHGDSFAYLVLRPALDGAGAEFGVTAYGPNSGAAAALMVEHIQAWDRLARDGQPTFAYWPTGTAQPDPVVDPAAPTAVLPKQHGVITISWSANRPPPTA